MEDCSIVGSTTPHQLTGNFHIYGHSFPSYYDMLVGNAFLEFEDLMYSVGRIENGIKREKNMDTKAIILKKKRIIFDEHVQAMTREWGSKRKSHMTRDEPVKNFPHLSSHTQVPFACSPSSQMPIWENGRKTSLSDFQSNKRKRTKVYHSFPMSYRELLSILT